MEKKEDLRITKTKKLLYETLLKEMENKAFEDIKVADLCNLSMINRSTFYSHYNDKYDLFIDLLNTLKKELFDKLDENNYIVSTKEYYLELIRLLLDHLDEHKKIYYSIILSNRNSLVVDIILDSTIKDINKRLNISNIDRKSVPTDVIVNFYLGAVSMVGLNYLKSDNKYSKQDIINYLSVLIPDNIWYYIYGSYISDTTNLTECLFL